MGKIRLRHGDSEIELDGDEAFIERQLDNFYARFKLSPESADSDKRLLHSSSKDVEAAAAAAADPTPAEYLKRFGNEDFAVEHQIIIFGSYLQTIRNQSDFAQNDINQLAKQAKFPKDIHGQYFTRAAKQGLLRAENGRYSLTRTAEDLLAGGLPIRTQRPKRTPAPKEASVKTTKSTKARSVTPEKFDPHQSGDIQSLEKFFLDKQPGKSTGQRIAVIAYYITRLKKEASFSEGQIDYAFRLLKLTGRPTFLRQILINNKNNNDWFDLAEDGTRWLLTRTGEIFVEEKLPPTEKRQ
jgi:hypothetical protein